MPERFYSEPSGAETVYETDEVHAHGVALPMSSPKLPSPGAPVPAARGESVPRANRVLLIEADERFQSSLSGYLTELGYAVDATHGDQADLGLLCRRDYAMIVVDVDSARNFLLTYPEAFTHSRLIILTSAEGLEWVRSRFRASLYRYLLKPIHLEELSSVMEQQSQVEDLQDQNRHLMSELKAYFSSQEIIGVSLGARRRRTFVSAFADYAAPMLLSGERGTGKETIARALHSHSQRSSFPFVHLDAARFPVPHFLNLVFGSVEPNPLGSPIVRRGLAELSGAGTVYISEINGLTHEQQRQLLELSVNRRFRRGGEAHAHRSEVRLIMGSELPLPALEESAALLPELSEYLVKSTLVIEPLRDRSEDIPLFVERFSRELAGRNQRDFAGFTPEALDALGAHRWPGNVSELKSTVETSIMRMRPQPVDLPQLRNLVGQVCEPVPRARVGEEGIDFYQVTSQFERALVESALRITAGNQRKASGLLRLKETTLSAMIKRLKVSSTTSP
ncbi:MAG: sigma-54-dependent Fis family transcriptional regulator [Acidobacteria bacterium]|nr:sigma-54-dependent Fis family transcriptional regulator [Acidobacteriota bacterium]